MRASPLRKICRDESDRSACPGRHSRCVAHRWYEAVYCRSDRDGQTPRIRRLDRWGHLGVACESRAEVDQRCAEAKAEGRLHRGGLDSDPPVGYTAFLIDPDGNSLELSYGQEVGLAFAKANPE
jgi:lactoylglutathione lyase